MQKQDIKANMLIIVAFSRLGDPSARLENVIMGNKFFLRQRIPKCIGLKVYVHINP